MYKSGRRCPVCGIKSYEILYTHKLNLPELLEFMPNTLPIVCCKNCGMIYTSSSASQEIYNRYYDTIHAYSENKNTHNEEEDCYSEELWEREYNMIKEYVCQECKVIDIGTGTGGMLKTFKKHGFSNLIGIDIDDKKELMLAEGFTFFQGDINALPLLDILNTKDLRSLFILNGVLEHIFDVRSAILALLDTLREQDYLFVMVPDADEYISCYDSAFRYFGMEHINHFNERTLKRLFEYFNFEVIFTQKIKYRQNNKNVDPAVCMLVKKRKFEMDIKGKDYVIAYIEKSRKADISVSKKISALMSSHKSIIIWGVGSYFMSICEKTKLLECNIMFLVDNNRSLQGTKLKGLEIREPRCIKNYPDCCICIVSAVYADNILQEIKEMCLINEVVII